MNKLSTYFWNYTYNNWKLTPKSRNVIAGAALIVLGGYLVGKQIEKKRK